MNSELDTMEKGRLRAFRAVFEEVPTPLHLPLRLAQGSAMELSRLQGRYNRLLNQTRQLQEDYDLLRGLLEQRR
jgi:hypothetical protein